MSQIHPQYDVPTHVGGSERLDRPPLNETLRRWVRRYSVENFRKNLALEFLRPRLWRFNQPDLTARLWENTIVIVTQLLRFLAVPESFEICEPRQITEADSEPSRQRSCSFNGRKVPLRRGPDGLHPCRISEPLLN